MLDAGVGTVGVDPNLGNTGADGEHDAPLARALAWAEVDDVGPASSGGVRLLCTRLLGALALDRLG